MPTETRPAPPVTQGSSTHGAVNLGEGTLPLISKRSRLRCSRENVLHGSSLDDGRAAKPLSVRPARQHTPLSAQLRRRVSRSSDASVPSNEPRSPCHREKGSGRDPPPVLAWPYNVTRHTCCSKSGLVTYGTERFVTRRTGDTCAGCKRSPSTGRWSRPSSPNAS